MVLPSLALSELVNVAVKSIWISFDDLVFDSSSFIAYIPRSVLGAVVVRIRRLFCECQL